MKKEQHIPATHLRMLLEAIHDGLIVCDIHNRISWLNRSACSLFNIHRTTSYTGMPYPQFLQRYHWLDENCNPVSLTSISQFSNSQHPIEQIVILTNAHWQMKWLQVTTLPTLNSRIEIIHQAHLFHDITVYHKQQTIVQESYAILLKLINAVSHVHELLLEPQNDTGCYLSVAMQNIAQQLTDILHQLLRSYSAALFILGPTEPYLSYAAISGFNEQQQQIRYASNGHYRLSDYLEQESIAQLYANNTVLLDRQHMHVPFLKSLDHPSTRVLWVPLQKQQRIAGFIVVAGNRDYRDDEINIVRAMSTMLTLFTDCVQLVQNTQGSNAQNLIHEETNRIINEFLNVASHELRTPLTMIMGNLQLATRRLETLKKQVTAMPEGEQQAALKKQIERVQAPLNSATEGTRTQEQIIQSLEDDASIQNHTFTMHMSYCNMTKLIQEVVTQQQREHQEQILIFTANPGTETLTAVADAARIKQVLSTYLRHAFLVAPRHSPVLISLTTHDHSIDISVHDDGPGLNAEEQQHLWERLTIPPHASEQNEQDLSLGLGLYICQTIVQLHHGKVGVNSTPQHGETLWFSLPVAQ